MLYNCNRLPDCNCKPPFISWFLNPEPEKEHPRVNLSKGSLNPSSSSTHPLSDNLEHQKAQSFLDVLVQLPFSALYIHKLQLMLSIDKQYYKELAQKEGHINRAKPYEEIIGRRHVTYTFSPNGTVGIAVKSSDTPFKF